MKKVGLKEKRKTKSLRRKIFGGMFFCLLLVAGYFLVFSPIFWIKNIEIKGTETIAPDRIKEIIERNLTEKKWRVIPQESVFLAPAGKIEQEILASFPEIKKAAVVKKLPDILFAEVEERKDIGIWCGQKKVIQKTEDKEEGTENEEEIIEKETIIENCFFLDADGVIFRRSAAMSGSLVLKVIDPKKQSAEIGEQVIAAETADFIRQIRNGLNKSLDLKILDFEVVSAGDIRARTNQGWRIEFNPLYSAEAQAENLKVVLENTIKENRASLEYVDLRIEGRVYYK